MKILILEDDGERVRSFYDMFCDDSLVVVNSSLSAIFLIRELKFDVIFLDHDLGGQTYVDSEEQNTGYQVSKIIDDSINKLTPIIIHSWNQIGVKRMKEVLKDHKGQVVSVPFGNFDRNIFCLNKI